MSVNGQTNDPGADAALERVRKAEADVRALTGKADLAHGAIVDKAPKLERQARLAALDGTPEAKAAYDILVANIESDKQTLVMISAAKKGAEKVLQEARQDLFRYTAGAQLKAHETLAGRKLKVIENLAAHIAAIGQDWPELFDIVARQRTTWPGGQPPLGSMCDIPELLHAVAIELHRVAAVEIGLPSDFPAFPGAARASLLGNPRTLPALVDKIAQANKFLLSQLSGASAPVEPIPELATVEDDQFVALTEPEPAPDPVFELPEVHSAAAVMATLKKQVLVP